MPPRTRLDRWLQRIEAVASLALFVLMSIVFVSVCARFFFNSPLKDQYDLSRMFLGVAVLWGIAAACASDEYVRSDIFWERLPPALRKAVDVFGRLVIVTAMAVVAWQVWFKLQDVARSGELTSELRLGIWPFYAVMFVGSVLALVGVGARLLMALAAPAAMPASHDRPGPADGAAMEG